MNSLRNRVQLIGRVGRDPEILHLESGKKMAKFSMATNDYFTNEKGERIDNTQWHLVVFWNKPAEIIEKYVFKGSQIAVEGKLNTRNWEDQTGVKHYTTEIYGNQIILLGSKQVPEPSPVTS